MTRMPAARADATPVIESSKANALEGSTPSMSQADR
jgi:hypothetical protein